MQPLGLLSLIFFYSFSPVPTMLSLCFTNYKQCYKYAGFCETANTSYIVHTAAVQEFEKCRSSGRLIVRDFVYFSPGTVL